MIRYYLLVLIAWNSLANAAPVKDQKKWFDQGFTEYMASRCNTALEPFYQASILEGAFKNLSHLYLAHCQSVLGQSDNAAFNLQLVDSSTLQKADKKLYSDLIVKHQADIDKISAINFSLSPYAGQTKVSPDSTKKGANYYGVSFSAFRPRWSAGLGYESLAVNMTSKTVADYSQSMIFGQAGYFVLDNFKLNASISSIDGSTDQLKSISALGLQGDYYITPAIAIYAEVYTSNFPKLLADSKGTYKYPVSANQIVLGGSFPIFNTNSFGFNGGLSLTSIALNKSSDKAALIDTTLDKDTQRVEAILSSWFGSATASLSYWTGKEVLGIHSRGAIISNSTDLKKGGLKLGLAYYFNKNVNAGLSLSSETFESFDSTSFTYKDFTSTGTTANLTLNW